MGDSGGSSEGQNADQRADSADSAYEDLNGNKNSIGN
jgi:hypothetical protein